MSAPIDVLAVMDAASNVLAIHKNADPMGRLIEARALVEGLINAASDVSAELTTEPEPGTPHARLDAALRALGELDEPQHDPQPYERDEAAYVAHCMGEVTP